jgi:hypothetical protein
MASCGSPLRTVAGLARMDERWSQDEPGRPHGGIRGSRAPSYELPLRTAVDGERRVRWRSRWRLAAAAVLAAGAAVAGAGLGSQLLNHPGQPRASQAQVWSGTAEGSGPATGAWAAGAGGGGRGWLVAPVAVTCRNITGPLGAPQGIPFTEFT